jgi:uncharacterized protein
MVKNAADDAAGKPLARPAKDRGRRFILARYPWLGFVLPWVVYMLLGSLEPQAVSVGETTASPAIPYRCYPIVYTLKIACTFGTILLVLPTYKKFPWRVTWWAPLFGLAGVVVWVGLCTLQLEQRCLPWLHLDWLAELGRRSAYNPFQELAVASASWAWTFLAVRFFGLVVLVPIVEEFFLRGFLMPFCVRADWWNVPFGTMTRGAVLIAVLYGIVTHPAELAAATVWFALVTWLMARTKSIWDCVVAHAVTNALLGVYVLSSGNWQFL